MGKATAVAVLVAMAIAVGGCKRSEAPGSESPERAALLEAVADCTLGVVRSFVPATAALQEAAAKAAADPTAANLNIARQRWVEAMQIWQVAELMQFGPAAAQDSPGGQDLRDPIYSWPLVSRCLIEQTLVSKAYEAPDFVATSLINVRSLAAAEYLLFHEGSDNACPSTASINTAGTWAALAPSELAARKAQYAGVVVADVAWRARKLAEAWEPDQGGFHTQLATAGRGSRLFGSSQTALNVVSDALFYVDHSTKDQKLGRPLGLIDCTTGTCPEALESRYARRSKYHVRDNLEGLRKVMLGCSQGEAGDGRGMDDLLQSAGADDLAARMRSELEAAQQAADAIDEVDYDETIAQDIESLRGLHAAIKKVTDAMKNEVVAALEFELPQRVEGDND